MPAYVVLRLCNILPVCFTAKNSMPHTVKPEFRTLETDLRIQSPASSRIIKRSVGVTLFEQVSSDLIGACTSGRRSVTATGMFIVAATRSAQCWIHEIHIHSQTYCGQISQRQYIDPALSPNDPSPNDQLLNSSCALRLSNHHIKCCLQRRLPIDILGFVPFKDVHLCRSKLARRHLVHEELVDLGGAAALCLGKAVPGPNGAEQA